MDMVKELAKAEEARREAFRRYEIAQENHFRSEVYPRMKRSIGHCYRYRNSYSCPQKPSDYWYIFARIVGIEDRSFKLLEVQCDTYSRVTLQFNSHCTAHDGTLYEGYEPITRRQYDRAVKDIMAVAKGMLSL